MEQFVDENQEVAQKKNRKCCRHAWARDSCIKRGSSALTVGGDRLGSLCAPWLLGCRFSCRCSCLREKNQKSAPENREHMHAQENGASSEAPVRLPWEVKVFKAGVRDGGLGAAAAVCGRKIRNVLPENREHIHAKEIGASSEAPVRLPWEFKVFDCLNEMVDFEFRDFGICFAWLCRDSP